ncbi:MAG: hypothetical protein H6Q89_765, partial [Myxococcaceae bacterium]|nr:hypothetical protein [Myxococcaceae bacterium]
GTAGGAGGGTAGGAGGGSGLAGDTCQSAETITVFPAVIAATTVGYTGDYDGSTTSTCLGTSGRDRVYVVSVPNGQRITANVLGSGAYDPSIGLIIGPAANCDAAMRVCVDSNDNVSSTIPAAVQYTNNTGTLQSVLILIDEFTSADPGGAFTLNVNVVTPTVPANDQCAGALVIPTATFPVTTAVVDIGNATNTNDQVPSTCTTNVGFGVWWTFAPTTTADYTIASCASGPTATTVPDTVLSIFTSSTGTCTGTMVQVGGGCNDDGCASQSSVTVTLTAGTTYYILGYQYSTTPPIAGETSIQLRLTQAVAPTAPANDLCSAAPVLNLNLPVTGTTAGAANDYQIDAGCFVGVGNLTSTTPGRDVAYAFTPLVAGNYSFRARTATADLAMYLSNTCSTGTAPVEVATCRNAVDRTGASAEEINCVALTASSQVFAYVDAKTLAGGSSFEIEVNACRLEAEPNQAPASSGPLSCGVTGGIVPAGDVDFYSLGSPVTGSRVFALADGISGADGDFDMRVTTATDTLQYNDFGNAAQFDDNAPSVAGTPLTGVASFIRMNHYDALIQSEPYRLYVVVQPPLASAAAEVEQNGTTSAANFSNLNYFSGSLSGASPSTDLDVYSFTASAGDLLYIALDGDPTRNNTPLNAQLELLNSAGVVLLTVNDDSSTSNITAGAGLTATTPRSPNDSLIWRVRTSGTHYVRVAAGSTSTTTAAGDYLLSISKNCVAGSTPALGPAPVLLGTAGNYVLLAKTAISTVPASAVTGDIAVSPAAATFITGFSLVADSTNVFSTSTQVVGQVFAASYAVPTPTNLTTAISDMQTAYTDAASRPTPNFLELGTGNIGGLTLVPGLYKWTSTVTIPNSVTIAGGPNDVWIFQTTGDLQLSANQSVILSGGAQAKNIFWQVAGQVTFGANSHFEGIVLTQTQATLQTGASMNGRVLAQTQIALQQATVVGP